MQSSASPKFDGRALNNLGNGNIKKICIFGSPKQVRIEVSWGCPYDPLQILTFLLLPYFLNIGLTQFNLKSIVRREFEGKALKWGAAPHPT